MNIAYTKMHGTGNQILVVDQRHGTAVPPSSEQLRVLGNDTTGPGFDQLMWVTASDDPAFAARYRVFNKDGSEVEQCGNGARCVGLYLELNNEYPGEPFQVESPAGVVSMRRCDDGEYELDMGVPGFEPRLIPLSLQPEGGMYSLESPFGLIATKPSRK